MQTYEFAPPISAIRTNPFAQRLWRDCLKFCGTRRLFAHSHKVFQKLSNSHKSVLTVAQIKSETLLKPQSEITLFSEAKPDFFVGFIRIPTRRRTVNAFENAEQTNAPAPLKIHNY